MSKKLIWWAARDVKGILFQPTIVLMRSDWPDGQRIYEIGLYDPGRFFPWTDAHGGALEKPDYFTAAEGQSIVEYLTIPADREYTYAPKKDGEG